MFAAYKQEKQEEHKEIKDNWLFNPSYVTKTEPVQSATPQTSKVSSYPSSESSESTTSSSEDKKSKKRAKKEKKKKKKKHKKSKPVKLDQTLQSLLIDKDYLKFFSQFSKDQIKNFNFYEDVPNLTKRNALKLDKQGDKNNLSFDTVYFKKLCKYNLPPSERAAKNRKKITRKQYLNEMKQKRYFNLIKHINQDECVKKPQAGVTNKMWLHLQVKQEEEEQEKLKEKELINEYTKYLNENTSDVNKWLEFVQYQCKLGFSPSILYERQEAIFQKALKENPNNFRLNLELLKLKSSSIEVLKNAYDSIEKLELEYFALLAKETNNSNILQIWIELFNFVQNNNQTNITFSHINQLYKTCFQFLNKLVLSEDDLVQYLNIFENYTKFLKQSGYMEKSIGLYQALIDFNLETNELKTRDRLVLFELFWDLSLPKFGEKFSTGWLSCFNNKNQVFKQLENEPHQARFDDYLDQVDNVVLQWKTSRIEFRWLEIERLRSLFNYYPFYARTAIGESSDDCIDPDRLVLFEDLCLFDLNKNEKLIFKLFSSFLTHLDLIDQDGTEIQETKLRNFLKSTNFFKNLFIHYYSDDNRYTSEQQSNLKQNIKKLISNTIDFVRNSIEQVLKNLKSPKYKTFVTILKWNFEFKLLNLVKNRIKFEHDDDDVDLFDYEILKSNLVKQLKNDLSREENRSNFKLWLEYGVLKCALNLNLKETKKVFDTLLTTSESAFNYDLDSCLNIYSLCLAYCELELGIYSRAFDIDSDLEVFVPFEIESNKKITQTSKEYLRDLIASNCLKKSTNNKLTFKIGISDKTKLLLVKRDFELEYNTFKNEDSKSQKFILFHKIYTLFLYCLNDLDKLFQTNDSILNLDSSLIKFYVKILNLMSSQNDISKFMFKTKLNLIINTVKTKLTKSCYYEIEKSLIKLKLDQSSILVNQVIELCDVELLFKKLSSKYPIVYMSQIYSLFIKQEKIKQLESDLNISSYGLDNQIRRLYQECAKFEPKFVQMWINYFYFEANLNNKNQLLSIYYQSIRSLPHVKLLYLNSIKYVPDKYNEIVNLMDKKELRVYLPIQELNILLEPIKRPDELATIKSESEEESVQSEHEQESESELESDETSAKSSEIELSEATDSDLSFD